MNDIINQTDTATGDAVTMNGFSDRKTGRVIKRTPKSIWVQHCRQTLDREASSLTTIPGGFCGHTYGEQVWTVEDDETGPVDRYTLRTTRQGHQIWKRAGWGTYSPGGTLTEGHHPHYDFNF